MTLKPVAVSSRQVEGRRYLVRDQEILLDQRFHERFRRQKNATRWNSTQNRRACSITCVCLPSSNSGRARPISNALAASSMHRVRSSLSHGGETQRGST